MKGLLRILIVVVVSRAAQSQALFVPPLFNLSQIDYNPAVTGSRESLSFLMSHRAHPLLQYSQVQGDGFLSKQKLGMGGLLEVYESLLETRTSFRINFSYRITTTKGFWQMGLAPVLHQYRVNTGNLNVRDQSDGLVPTNTQQTSLNFNAGILYKSPKWFLSAAAQNIAPSLNPGYDYLLENHLYSLAVARLFHLGKGWFCQPLAYAQTSEQQGAFAALGSQLGYRSVFVGGQIGTPQSWSANAGVDYRPAASNYHLRIGYTVSSQTQGLSPMWAHEIYLTIGFHKFGATPKSLESLPKFCSPVYF